MIGKNKIWVVALIGLVAFSVSACSSSSKGATSATTANSSSSGSTGTTVATGTPIKIGVICGCTGAFAEQTEPAWNVVEAWADTVNNAGGLNGHPVDLVQKDNGGNPGTSLTDAEDLISDHVAAIIDEDVLDASWEKEADAAKIPVLGGNIASELYDTDPDFYSSGETNDSVVYSVIATGKSAGVKKIAMLYCAEAPSCAQTVPEAKTVATSAGTPIVYTASISATAPNYTAQCVAAKQSGADAMWVADVVTVVARIASDCSTQGYNPTYLYEGTGFSDQILTATGLKENTWMSFPDLPYSSSEPAAEALITAIDKYYPSARKALGWSESAAEAWGAGLLLEAAAKNDGWTASESPTAADVLQGLNMISNDDLGGWSPSLTFSAGETHSVNCWYTAHVENGVLSQVGGQTCHS